ncbi:MAG: bifunctional (p)ppGpp synthetase/guanosine-3',5'-bis(diphosphate) 3'-pyrophosphohydrolase [Candidatus Gracilibacteria bacterium]|nr:bifunctional (p)ppGpp synthetase/guanosine-3',5'-bis(diphosphate) 3'-pyrophosphohydrolase [Candidatus Gracilibacteria bacterium]
MEYEKIDKQVEEIISDMIKYSTGFSPKHIHDEVWKSYIYARDAHEGQMRKSGEPYITHPVEATMILLSLQPDIHTVQACLLHDVIEDTPKTKEDIESFFGKDVAFLCEGLEKLSSVRYHGKEREIGSLRKMFIAMADDLRVIFIKLADRLHNMQTLKYHPKVEKREKIALETLTVFSPIADRLSLFNIKNALDEECFKILEPQNYKAILKQLKLLKASREAFIQNAKAEILKSLEGEVTNFEIDYRIKSIYSIYKKLQKKGHSDIGDLYDIFGMRIIVKNLSDCYKVLGVIHNNWLPLPYRFKDYIALPKPNGYKSIHTTVIGLLKEYRQQPTEIQIKTYDMKNYSDIGVAAHFEYKENGSIISKEVSWVNELKEIAESLGDKDFMGSLKIDLFKNRIFVFTPKGDLINLPYGSTAIDFAYYLHTDLGNHLSIAKVNDKIFPLDKKLKNGDRVELIIDKHKHPNPFWIRFVATAKAKNAIKSCLKREDKSVHRERGKDIINKYLEKSGCSTLDKDLSLLSSFDGRTYGLEERWQILEQIGNLSINPNAIIRKLSRKGLCGEGKKIEKGKKTEQKDTSGKKSVEIIIGGEENLIYKRCYCCRRKLPIEIVAHINIKSEFTIHKRDCKILQGVKKERLFSAYIKGNEVSEIVFQLHLVLKNKMGSLKKLTEIIFSMEMDIDEINSEKQGNLYIAFDLKINILNHDYLMIDRFIERLQISFNEDLITFKISES